MEKFLLWNSKYYPYDFCRNPRFPGYIKIFGQKSKACNKFFDKNLKCIQNVSKMYPGEWFFEKMISDSLSLFWRQKNGGQE